jgi:hypothetical protein
MEHKQLASLQKRGLPKFGLEPVGLSNFHEAHKKKNALVS